MPVVPVPFVAGAVPAQQNTPAGAQLRVELVERCVEAGVVRAEELLVLPLKVRVGHLHPSVNHKKGGEIRLDATVTYSDCNSETVVAAHPSEDYDHEQFFSAYTPGEVSLGLGSGEVTVRFA